MDHFAGDGPFDGTRVTKKISLLNTKNSVENTQRHYFFL
jgi:hypothetical protein